ncbi:MAG: phosphoenolpyruvate kinase, partial [Verrucomicrobiota bacterium]|nr:phosphoenolpyruvate kinase [Verrucomicrobiota bacterium]
MNPRTSLQPNENERISGPLMDANAQFLRRYPGESDRRQAVHSVYGGGHLFKADTAQRLGKVALRSLEEYAPDAASLARVLGTEADEQLSTKVYDRVVEKLRREPVEDFRLDFEDGYGNRPDEEEDQHAAASAAEVARGMAAGSLPPFI